MLGTCRLIGGVSGLVVVVPDGMDDRGNEQLFNRLARNHGCAEPEVNSLDIGCVVDLQLLCNGSLLMGELGSLESRTVPTYSD